MKTIPEIRARLFELSRELNCPELAVLAEESKRRPFVRKAPTKHLPLDDLTKQCIREYALENPNAHQQDIAVYFGVNSGRVSETLAGYREEG